MIYERKMNKNWTKNENQSDFWPFHQIITKEFPGPRRGLETPFRHRDCFACILLQTVYSTCQVTIGQWFRENRERMYCRIAFDLPLQAKPRWQPIPRVKAVQGVRCWPWVGLVHPAVEASRLISLTLKGLNCYWFVFWRIVNFWAQSQRPQTCFW